MKKIISILILTFSLCVISTAQTVRNIPVRTPSLSEREIINNIDSYVDEILNGWKVPGMSVSVCKDGRTLLLKGYGLKNLSDENNPVDEHTLFQIGSVSKSFTATIVAQLVDEGLLSWDDTVIKHLPEFRMYDPWVTEHVQLKDLTTHRTGLGGQMGTYLPNLGYDSDEIMEMMALMEPAYTFRGEYQYNNITFLPLAKVIEKVTGKSWEDNVRERIFLPLGMNESCIGGDEFAAALSEGKAALPYEFKRNGEEMQIRPLIGEEQALWWLTVIGPAGAIVSSAADMQKWAMFHLNNGKVGDRQIVSEKQMNFLHRGQNISIQNANKTTLYGQGWNIEQTRKCRIYWHTGSTWGMTALCAFVPELKLCITVDVNSEAPNAVRESIMRRAIDLFLGYDDHDYNKEALESWYANARNSAAREKAKAAEDFKEAPSFQSLTGTYHKDKPFGDIIISTEKQKKMKGMNGQPADKLFITICNGKRWKHELEHVNGNKFRFESDGKYFVATFRFEGEESQAVGVDINFSGGEKFGGWDRTRSGL